MSVAVKRPPHIDPRKWERASWHAQQQAEREYRIAQRAIEEQPAPIAVAPEPSAPIEVPDTPKTWAERVPLVDKLLNDHGLHPEAVAAHFGVKVGAAENAMRRAGRKDLAGPFARVRDFQRRRKCIDCSTSIGGTSTRCIPCAATEVASRPEVRAAKARALTTRRKDAA